MFSIMACHNNCVRLVAVFQTLFAGPSTAFRCGCYPNGLGGGFRGKLTVCEMLAAGGERRGCAAFADLQSPRQHISMYKDVQVSAALMTHLLQRDPLRRSSCLFA